MRYKEILSRLTGISCPIFGVSWEPPEADRTIARRVITFLEDRRVLYVDSEMEVPAHCVHSVMEIRRVLTDAIDHAGEESALAASIRAMRLACRKFLDRVQADECIIEHGASHGHFASWTFNGALGELRGTFGVHITTLAASYGLDVEDDLARILPENDEGGSNLTRATPDR